MSTSVMPAVWSRPAWQVDGWVRDFFGPVTDARADWPKDLTPAAELSKDGDDAVVRLDLPGLSTEAVANDINVEIDRGRLVIRGERRDERAETAAGRTLSEVRYGAFRRSFKLPGHVTGDAVTASYDAGVLTVRVAGVYAGSEPQRIAIDSK
ncbi:Hsp20/alpha crystallin family protein [Mycobacterium sp. 21AC1]|uniref:Hsp20/alpha crystallin family protein n=1 Tax=[Mycobacterium] appelbergii TaxID=2939269 RepID=UPI002938F9F3|nr:Hsp20/alpha crystallin family protein [Mycobacterium sp. 21AC1]MDV3126088.1 Hsp20/alpha crystallin family protein [Mycobacterium sp. 21AC1]